MEKRSISFLVKKISKKGGLIKNNLSWTIPGQNRFKRKGLLAKLQQPPDFIGAEGQNRTADTGIFRPILTN
jgi:hypothetical protein